MDFRQNLQNIVFTIKEKVQSTSIGNYLQRRIGYTQNDMKKKPIYDVI